MTEIIRKCADDSAKVCGFNLIEDAARDSALVRELEKKDDGKSESGYIVTEKIKEGDIEKTVVYFKFTEDEFIKLKDYREKTIAAFNEFKEIYHSNSVVIFGNTFSTKAFSELESFMQKHGGSSALAPSSSNPQSTSSTVPKSANPSSVQPSLDLDQSKTDGAPIPYAIVAPLKDYLVDKPDFELTEKSGQFFLKPKFLMTEANKEKFEDFAKNLGKKIAEWLQAISNVLPFDLTAEEAAQLEAVDVFANQVLPLGGGPKDGNFFSYTDKKGVLTIDEERLKIDPLYRAALQRFQKIIVSSEVFKKNEALKILISKSEILLKNIASQQDMVREYFASESLGAAPVLAHPRLMDAEHVSVKTKLDEKYYNLVKTAAASNGITITELPAEDEEGKKVCVITFDSKISVMQPFAKELLMMIESRLQEVDKKLPNKQNLSQEVLDTLGLSYDLDNLIRILLPFKDYKETEKSVIYYDAPIEAELYKRMEQRGLELYSKFFGNDFLPLIKGSSIKIDGKDVPFRRFTVDEKRLFSSLPEDQIYKNNFIAFCDAAFQAISEVWFENGVTLDSKSLRSVGNLYVMLNHFKHVLREDSKKLTLESNKRSQEHEDTLLNVIAGSLNLDDPDAVMKAISLLGDAEEYEVISKLISKLPQATHMAITNLDAHDNNQYMDRLLDIIERRNWRQ